MLLCLKHAPGLCPWFHLYAVYDTGALPFEWMTSQNKISVGGTDPPSYMNVKDDSSHVCINSTVCICVYAGAVSAALLPD